MPAAVSRRCVISAVSFGAGGAGGARRRRISKGPCRHTDTQTHRHADTLAHKHTHADADIWRTTHAT
eukprot:12790979-Alexandrium_andersonii.AAC.1